MMDTQKLALLVIGILFGAALGAGVYMTLTGQQHQAEVSEYQTDIRALEDVIDARDAEIVQLEGDLEDLQADMVLLQGQLVDLTTELDDLQAENALLQGQVDDLTGELDDLQADNVLLQGEVDDLTGELEDLQAENAVLQSQVDDLTSELEAQEASLEPEGPAEITIFHVNDLHGRAQSQDPQDGLVGGIAKIAYIVNQERDAGGNVVFLNAGDSIYGTILTNYYEGEPTVEAMDAAGLDAMVLGNHEFDFGQESMLGAWSFSDHPWLCANVVNVSTGESPEFVEEYVILEVGGIDVAVLGLFGQEGYFDYNPSLIEGLEFGGSLEVAESLLPLLDAESDLVIALTHEGYNSDVSLAQETDGFDVIVGGHSHTSLGSPEYVDGTIIVQAWNHGLVLGRLDITVDDDAVISYSGELIPITEDIPDDPDVAAALQPYVDEYGPIMNEVVGVSLVDLNAETEALRGTDTNAGNLVTDAMLWQAGDADIAIHNSGGFRWKRVFPAGDITRADAHELLPFQNLLYVAEFTGAQIRQELEYIADGGYAQVAGVRFTYDTTLPSGGRVTEATVGGEPLDDGRVYRVAMGKFLVDGGSGHWVLAEGEGYENRGIMLADCLVNYLQEFSPVSPVADGRITEVP